MPRLSRLQWLFGLALLTATAFGVFALPFLFPPALFPMVSAANLAGFNNKLAAIAAAVAATLAIVARLLWPSLTLRRRSFPTPPLPGWLVIAVPAVYVGTLAALALYMAELPLREILDAAYFLNQIGNHVLYGRQLYTQIEFPYGPLLFASTTIVHALLTPLHASLTTSYYVNLLLQHLAGILLLAYITNSLPMSRAWKSFLFVALTFATFNFDFGLNYTLFRFTIAPASLVLISRIRGLAPALAAIFLGEILCLSISPEMGFGFAAGAIAFALHRAWLGPQLWLVAVPAPPVAAALFLWLNGGGYLLMMGMFAKGVFNLLVEPQPNVLVFLLALVWFTPIALARALRERSPDSPRMVALFFYTLALLPVAFGRADGGHILLNGFPALLLAGVALSGSRRSTQAVYAAAFALSILLLWTIAARFYRDRMREHLHASIHFHPDWLVTRATLALLRPRHPALATHLEAAPVEPAFSIDQLRAVTHDPVITPEFVPLRVENDLKASHQYVPTFYYFGPALDQAGAVRQTDELNRYGWALVPVEAPYRYTETPASTAPLLGLRFPYRSIRQPPWIAGDLLAGTLEHTWVPVQRIGDFMLYRHP